jgi:methionyl-tRNA formyltransferase
MRILFMGSAAFACPPLDALLANSAADVVGVVTQPDRPKGRSLEVTACPVKSQADRLGIPVLTPERVNDADSLAQIEALRPELIVVVAYGQILRKTLRDMPRFGCINVHASLLPRYRGAAPIQWAIARGARLTGVSTMFLSARMDAGDIILQREAAIEPADTGGSLHDRLAHFGAELLSATVDMIRKGTAPRTAQDEAEATYAPKLKRSDGRIDWGLRAEGLHHRVRAFNPWPGCACEVPAGSGHFLKVLRARVESGSGRPGTVIAIDGEGPLVQTGYAALRLLEVQPEGRKAMSGSAFVRGHGLRAGQVLG